MNEAFELLRAGFSVLPIQPGRKRPPTNDDSDQRWYGYQWKEFSNRLPSEDEVETFLARYPGCSLGVATGCTGLEVLDFDSPDKDGHAPAFEPWRDLLDDDELLGKLAIVKTPSGGRHLWYRYENPSGNTKIAELPDGRVLIETRGAGGLVVCPPTPGYKWVQGSPETVPTLTALERQKLWNAAKTLDQRPPVEHVEPNRPTNDGEGLSAWDDYERQCDGEELLSRNGWVRLNQTYQGGSLWVRPGKSPKAGPSARLGRYDKGIRFYCWSTNAPVPSNQLLRLPALRAHLEFGGDYKACAKALATEGFGRPAQSPGVKVTSGDIPGQPEPDRTVDPETGEVRRKHPLTDVGNAERLVSMFSGQMLWCHPFGCWYVWDGTRWVRDESGGAPVYQRAIETVRAMKESNSDDVRKWGGKCESKSRLNAMVELAKVLPGVAILPSQLDRDDWLLCVQNGVVDLRTGTLMPHDKGRLITRLCNTSYEPEAECEALTSFLVDRFPDPGTLEFVVRSIGYTLTGSIREEVFLFIYGPGGRGKSTLAETVAATMGDYAVSLPTEALLIRNNDQIPNDIARLKGARLALAAETDDGRRWNEPLLKRLTGGDTISARFMRAEFFDFVNRSKLWITGNHRPEVRNFDAAMRRRLRVIPMDQPVPEPDTKLKERLQSPESMAAMLAIGVRSCLEWLSSGLAEPDQVKTAVEAYAEESDHTGRFVSERVKIEDGWRVKCGEAYAAYCEWAKASGVREISQIKFTRYLAGLGIESVKGTYGTRYYSGMAIIGDGVFNITSGEQVIA